jgi:hypothetical protein
MPNETHCYFDKIIEMLDHLPTHQEYVRIYNELMGQDFKKRERNGEPFLHEGIPSLDVFNSRIKHIENQRISDFLKEHFNYGGNPESFEFEWIPSASCFAKHILKDIKGGLIINSLCYLLKHDQYRQYTCKRGDDEFLEVFLERQARAKEAFFNMLSSYNQYQSFTIMRKCLDAFVKKYPRPTRTWYPYRENRKDCVTPEEYITLLQKGDKDSSLEWQSFVDRELEQLVYVSNGYKK